MSFHYVLYRIKALQSIVDPGFGHGGPTLKQEGCTLSE